MLDALYTSDLMVSANSTALARWDAKLGFQKHVFVSSLARLLPDGGLIGKIDVIVERVYPVGYMEGTLTSRGTVQYGGPQYSEDEEAERHATWELRCAETRARFAAILPQLSKAAAWLDSRTTATVFQPGDSNDAHDAGAMGMLDMEKAHAYVRELETQADPFASVVQATESDLSLIHISERAGKADR